MNDLSVASRFTARNADLSAPAVAVPLAKLCDAGANAFELLSPMPTLRQVARTVLATVLAEGGMDFNPDVLFLNRRAADGSLLSSVSLTEGLIQTYITGLGSISDDSTAVYTRHDTVDDAHLAVAIDDQKLTSVLADASERLSDHYGDVLHSFWSEVVDDSAIAGKRVTRQQLWASLQRAAFCHEVELAGFNNELGGQDKARLQQLLDQPFDEGVYRVSVVAGEQPAALLHSAFVITLLPASAELLAPENSEGPVFLLTAMKGVEKFSTLSLLTETVSQRFAYGDQRQSLLDDMLLVRAEQFSMATAVDVEYRSCAGHFEEILAAAVRNRRAEDMRYLFATASQRADVKSFLTTVEKSQTFTYLDEARRQRVLAHMQRLQAITTPHWLKYADEEQQASFQILDTEHRRRADTVNQLFAGLESLEQYASRQIDDYIRLHLGYTVDPEQVFITLQDQWPSPVGEMKATYKKSLLEFVLDGLPATGEASEALVALPDASTHPRFTFEFVDKLIADLDVRYQYRQALEARYQRADTQRALLHQRDSALAFSALTAQLQGHFFLGDGEHKSQGLIWTVRGDQTKPGALIRMGGLEVGAVGNQLRDVIVFSEETEHDAHYVLYAPGAPGGRDMYEFDSWRKLYHQVAGWSATPGGRQYLISQSASAFLENSAAFVQAVSEKPTRWKVENVRFVASQHADFQSGLSELINLKITHELADLPVVVAGERTAATYRDRRILATLDERIRELNSRYEQRMQLMSYPEYAKKTGAHYISRAFQRTGINQKIDPDTVYFDLHSQDRRSHPEFGSHTDLVSLTQLLMNDFTYKLNDHAPMYSSIGQDLSVLSRAIVKEILDLPLGEEYVKLLGREYGNRNHPDYLYRKALFAQRMYFEMTRDALITYLENGLSQQQYQWVRLLLSTLFPHDGTRTYPIAEQVNNSSINTFYLNGRLIEGVFVFKNADLQEKDNLLIYTPNAPDGLRFRSYDVFVSTLTAPGMDAYYYGRVSYKSQPAIGTFFQKLTKNRTLTLASMTFDASERIRDLQSLHDRMIGRMMQDVDDQSLSKAESFVESLYTIVKWTGTIFLLPFPPAAVAWGLLHTSIEAARGYLAYLDGDRAAASRYYVWGVLGVVLGGLGAKDIVQSTSGLGLRTLTWVARKSHPGFP